MGERTGGLGPALEERIERERKNGGLPVVVGRDGHVEGLIVVGDEPRADWEQTVTSLHERGVDVVVLTGTPRRRPDASWTTLRRSRLCGRSAGRKDGCGRTAQRTGPGRDGGRRNERRPALAEADLGVSLGSGTALASDAADLAIVDEELAGVERAFDLATAARGRLRQNLGLALVYNAIAVPIAVVGLLNPLFATAAAVVTAALVAANASRSLVDGA